MALDIIITLLLVFLNGFFVAAEFAIVKVRTSQIETKGHKNLNISNTAKNILKNLDGYLAATQLGITLASLGLGWIGEGVVSAIILRIFHGFNLDLSAQTAHNLALPIAFAVITILHIVFGELAPKSVAIRYPVRTTFGVALPLRLFYVVFRPFIWALNGLANVLLKLVGIKPMHGTEIHTEEELKVIIQESREGGQIQQVEQNIVERVFALGDRKVSELMTHRRDLIWFEVNDTLDIVKQKSAMETHSVYVVAKNRLDDLLGVIAIKDIFPKDFNAQPFNLKDFIKKPIFVHENTSAYKVLEQFKNTKLHYAMVVDEYGGLQGMLAMDDIVDALVGDVTEYNQEEYQIIQRDNNSWLADGQYSFFEFLMYFNIEDDVKSEGNFNTLAGLIIHLLKNIPIAGQKIKWNDFEFEVIDMDGNRIDKILITRNN
ncbi:hemolysin family protein [Flavobacterium sp.]|uniref:hemolysin family protein n=1 Tax=Flavobacterium sp. TaxID=239 RepID=UPI003266A34B